ncbi:MULTISPECIES: helix-turn-helix domain-containing protein [Streptomyces]|uniref:helix-turn-helix domain-containing protein n=1 Tax=Streptomyces TaxID=1883 RepID=UPI001CC23486|nr:helix-turn-helix domain-containing protein [Streptomyces venezuelae]
MASRAERVLVRPDGSVIIPPTAAGDVLRALVRDLTARVRADGGEVTPDIRRILYALHTAAQHAEPPAAGHGSDTGTAPPGPATVEVAVDEAAELLECTPEYVRRLARRGTLTARRIGARTWAIDRTGLDNYRHGTGAPTS